MSVNFSMSKEESNTLSSDNNFLVISDGDKKYKIFYQAKAPDKKEKDKLVQIKVTNENGKSELLYMNIDDIRKHTGLSSSEIKKFGGKNIIDLFGRVFGQRDVIKDVFYYSTSLRPASKEQKTNESLRINISRIGNNQEVVLESIAIKSLLGVDKDKKIGFFDKFRFKKISVGDIYIKSNKQENFLMNIGSLSKYLGLSRFAVLRMSSEEVEELFQKKIKENLNANDPRLKKIQEAASSHADVLKTKFLQGDVQSRQPLKAQSASIFTRELEEVADKSVNESTQILQEIFNELLHADLRTVNFIVSGNIMLVEHKGKKYDLQKLLAKVDLNRVQVSERDIEAYEKRFEWPLIEFIPFKYRPREAVAKQVDPSGKIPLEKREQFRPDASLSHLSYGEMIAINVYTGGDSDGMNHLMRCNINGFFETHRYDATIMAPHALVTSIIAIHGLNRIPDQGPPKGGYFFRVEQSIEEVAAKRDEALSVGRGMTRELGFFSTSKEAPDSNITSKIVGPNNDKKLVGIVVRGGRGKNISSISQFPQEKEYLMPPSQLQWIGKKSEDNCDIYYARQVQNSAYRKIVKKGAKETQTK